MTTLPRTPTPNLLRIWSHKAKINRWHRLWIRHLQAQADLNPNHPANRNGDLFKYKRAADLFEASAGPVGWFDQLEQVEQQTRHDLVAALQVFNQRAGASTAHLGLTSHDIVDVATQQAVLQSLDWVITETASLAQQLAADMRRLASLPVVARTHGQPAQITSYGLRWATVLGALLEWHQRAGEGFGSYAIRPSYGAVGTGADLLRVLTGWRKASEDRCNQTTSGIEGERRCILPAGHPTTGIYPNGHDWEPHPEVEARQLVTSYLERLGLSEEVSITARQTYHRSQDLHIASLLVQLASIAQTWATDRRLEAMLGLGNEGRDPGQVGSSAMAHKTNPVLCERIVSLCAISRGHLATAAELAGVEWLEGDVSGSAGRRHWLEGIFLNTEAILVNWREANQRWHVDADQMAAEVDFNAVSLATGAVLQLLVEHGIDRDRAHQAIKAASEWLVAAERWGFVALLAGSPIAAEAKVSYAAIREAVIGASRLPVGNINHQIEQISNLVAGWK